MTAATIQYGENKFSIECRPVDIITWFKDNSVMYSWDIETVITKPTHFVGLTPQTSKSEEKYIFRVIHHEDYIAAKLQWS